MDKSGKIWVAGALAVAAAVSVAACEPDDGLGSSVVSVTTDQLATHALESDGVKVQWLSCSAQTKKAGASVDCVGRTDDRQEISVEGEVTRQMEDLCVRGHLTAKVGSRQVFAVRGLGNCENRSAAAS
jgi:hypothetical protein